MFVDGICVVYCVEFDVIFVNKVCKYVIDEFDFDEEFFVSVKWKVKSKIIIKEIVVCRCYIM